MTEKELKGYAGDRKKPLWGWLISDAKKYDIPRKIEFYGLKRPPQSWQYYEEERTC
ncbi:MAG: hypothetical protein HFH41_03935 [Lachnospiraceae bacterium]|nr:hypothetical protein [Lachnospiraceae bacterium]